MNYKTVLLPIDPYEELPNNDTEVLVKFKKDYFLAKYKESGMKTIVGNKIIRHDKTATFYSKKRAVHFHQFEDVIWYKEIKINLDNERISNKRGEIETIGDTNISL